MASGAFIFVFWKSSNALPRVCEAHKKEKSSNALPRVSTWVKKEKSSNALPRVCENKNEGPRSHTDQGFQNEVLKKTLEIVFFT